MPQKTIAAELILSKLKEADALLRQGKTVPQVCQLIGVPESTFYRWRRLYGARQNPPPPRKREP